MIKTVNRTVLKDIRVCDVCGRELWETGKFAHFKKRWRLVHFPCMKFKEEHDFCEGCYKKLCNVVNSIPVKDLKSLGESLEFGFDQVDPFVMTNSPSEYTAEIRAVAVATCMSYEAEKGGIRK